MVSPAVDETQMTVNADAAFAFGDDSLNNTQGNVSSVYD
jgi:hypothetical protein